MKNTKNTRISTQTQHVSYYYFYPAVSIPQNHSHADCLLNGTGRLPYLFNQVFWPCKGNVFIEQKKMIPALRPDDRPDGRRSCVIRGSYGAQANFLLSINTKLLTELT